MERYFGDGADPQQLKQLPEDLEDVVQAIQLQHHYLPRAGASSCVNLVRLANALAKRHGYNVGDSVPEEADVQGIIEEGMRILRLEPEQETALAEGLKARMDQAQPALQTTTAPAG